MEVLGWRLVTAYAEIPLTGGIVRAVAARFRIEVPPPPWRRLHGGEESAAYRVGGHVVRIGPAWRPDDQVEWCHAVARHAAAAVPEFLAPLRERDGRTVIRPGGRPVTVWRFVPGARADDRNPAHRRHAAALLARFHLAMAGLDLGPPPALPHRGPVPPEVADPDLDGWLADFDRRHPQRHPLHGDYYAGNALAQGERLVAVLDYDEAYLGPPQREAVHAAWEWGDGLAAGKLDGAHEFLGAYAAESGPGADLDDTALRQLIRERLRSEIRWARTVTERGITRDADDRSYTQAQIESFWTLRPRAP